MRFIEIATTLVGLLATCEAVSIRFHALNHCHKSPIDVGCAHIHKNVCCAIHDTY